MTAAVLPDAAEPPSPAAKPRADGLRDPRTILAVAVTVLLWASAFVVIRSAAVQFGPGELALGRLTAGSVVLTAIWLVRGEGLPARAAWPGIVLAGVLWFGGYMVVLNWGERKVDAGTASMLVNIGPILIALLSGWLLKEGFPPRLLAGIVVSFAGAVVVGLAGSDGSRISPLGVALCLVAAATYAAGTVSQKVALRHASALQVTTFGCLIGTAACLPFAGGLVTQAAHEPWTASAKLVYLGVFPTALAFTAWAYALARTSAGKMGSTTYVVPTLVILMSWIALNQVPGWIAFVGGLLCLAGVGVSRSRPRKGARLTST
ncbi:MAG TPA: DMT family transporter [Actinocrinis sp.]|nr:DMT family transporter [Actinocrinis sp.]